MQKPPPAATGDGQADKIRITIDPSACQHGGKDKEITIRVKGELCLRTRRYAFRIRATESALWEVCRKHRKVRRETPAATAPKGTVTVFVPEIGITNKVRRIPRGAPGFGSDISPRDIREDPIRSQTAQNAQRTAGSAMRRILPCVSWTGVRIARCVSNGSTCSIGAMLPCKQRVAGASPVASTIFKRSAAGKRFRNR